MKNLKYLEIGNLEFEVEYDNLSFLFCNLEPLFVDFFCFTKLSILKMPHFQLNVDKNLHVNVKMGDKMGNNNRPIFNIGIG